ncbi:unnamed protein product [Pleuronectes platessa]|uniref:Uncharacterized protein n=1 Tax=Pleuronectes platessa TaxID=8262 RepID=A0A9N7W0Q9_PLEPL|nr:unnamed protein product [Pleuronectes platessa]
MTSLTVRVVDWRRGIKVPPIPALNQSGLQLRPPAPRGREAEDDLTQGTISAPTTRDHSTISSLFYWYHWYHFKHFHAPLLFPVSLPSSSSSSFALLSLSLVPHPPVWDGNVMFSAQLISISTSGVLPAAPRLTMMLSSFLGFPSSETGTMRIKRGGRKEGRKEGRREGGEEDQVDSVDAT